MDAFVSVILGSESDRQIVDDSGMLKVFDEVGIEYEMSYISAHRNPKELGEYVRRVLGKAKVFICAASMAAALPGAVAAETGGDIPVIGVPLPSREYPDGMDAVLAMLRMPPGRPVLVVGPGKAGLKNAALAACQIMVNTRDVPIDRAHEFYTYQDQTNKPAQIRVDVHDGKGV